MQYALKDEIAHFKGNASRNFMKLFRSGIIQEIIRYHKCCAKNPQKTPEPLKISIREGNPKDAHVLLTSVAEQSWRERAEEFNSLPKGHTRSPKLGARNLAFSKGLDPTEIANYFDFRQGGVIVYPPGASEINEYAQKNLVELDIPELYGMF